MECITDFSTVEQKWFWILSPKLLGLKRVRGRLRQRQNEEPENKIKETAPQSRRIIEENCMVKPKDQLLDSVFQYDENCETKPKGQLSSTATPKELEPHQNHSCSTKQAKFGRIKRKEKHTCENHQRKDNHDHKPQRLKKSRTIFHKQSKEEQ